MTKNRIVSLLVLLGSLSLMIGGVVLILFATPIHDDVLPTLASFASPQADNNTTLAPVPVSNRQAATVLPSGQASALPAQSQPLVVQPSSEAVPEQVVLTFAPDSSAAERAAYITAMGGVVTKDVAALNTVVVNVPAAAVAFAPPPSPLLVESEPNYYVVAQHEIMENVLPNDPRLPEQWALPLIGAVASWHHLTPDTPKVTVAVIDSGICEHPELMGRVLAGYDFIEDDTNPQDEFGHGCGVAGILAANSNDGIGMAGAAANIQIMPLRVLDRSGIGTYAQVAAAIVYAVDNGADIINISLGGTNASNTLQSAVAYAAEHDVLLVAAAGNAGAESVLYPAAYADVIAVGSIDSNLRRSSFSNYGSGIGLWGPGRDILATNTNGGYSLMSGTSFAAPHVAAVAALEQALGGRLIVDGNIVAVGGQPQVSSTETPPAPTLTPGGPTPTPNAAAVNSLFVETSAQGALSLEANLGVIRSRYTDINFSAISQTGSQGVSPQSALSEPVTLNLFDDVSLTTVFNTVEDHELTNNGFVWIGHIDGHAEDSETVLVVGDGQMAGYVRTLGKLYQIAYAGNGVHAINEISEEAFVARHIHPIVPEGIETLDDPGVAPQTVSASGFAQIDLMVLYTSLAQSDLGGGIATQNAIRLAVAAVNQAYVNSDVNARIRLVYTGFVDYNETYGDCYSGYPCNDVYNIGGMGPNASIGNTVANLRNDYQADVVTLITNNTPAYCGIAFQMAGAGQPATNFQVYAFNVVWSQCLAGGRTLAHEIGHNMGAAHNYEDRALNSGLYSDSYGYWSPNNAFHTIMSYQNCALPCVNISRFSDPNQTFGGLPLGDNRADNVRTLNNTAPIVAGFRTPTNSNLEPTATPAGPEPTATPVEPLPTPGALAQCNFTIANGNVTALSNAISAANGNGSGSDTICLASGGVYLVSTLINGNAFPAITTPMTIIGNGATIRRIGSDRFRFFEVSTGISFTINDLTLENGFSPMDGGAIFSRGNLTVINSTFRNNLSNRSSYIFNHGGAIHAFSGTVSIYGSYFVGNSAVNGGSVSALGSATINVNQSHFFENSGELGGAVYTDSSGTSYVSGSCLIGNSPNAVYNDRTTPAINAVNNWWDSIHGPSLEFALTTDRGDYISSGVNYEPYQLRPSAICLPRPETPALDSSFPGITSILQPTLGWAAVADAINYELEISVDPYFQTAERHNMSGTTFVIPAPLAENQYYWRVRAYNGGMFSPWSLAHSLIIDTTAPAIPTLLDPVNGLETTNQRPLFSWNYNGDVALYEFSLTGPGMVDPITTPYTSYNFDGPLLPNRDDIEYPYSWRVRAQDTAGNWSDWSETRTFEINSEEDAAPELTLYTSVDFTLTWGEITWAQAYHLQIAYDEDFDYLMLNHDSLASDETSLVIEGMRLGRYYWRVRAQNDKGVWSKWSSDSFQVVDGDPMNP